jgi:hypothetical protein
LKNKQVGEEEKNANRLENRLNIPNTHTKKGKINVKIIDE